jgi:hypothetical protein
MNADEEKRGEPRMSTDGTDDTDEEKRRAWRKKQRDTGEESNQKMVPFSGE